MNNSMLKIIESNKKISIRTINNFEKEFKIILPDDYKSFLLGYNGGEPEENMIFSFNNKVFSPFSVCEFYDLSTIKMFIKADISNSENDIFEFIKNKIIYICNTRGDFDICMSTKPKTRGYIYVYDMEETTGKPFILISNSFTEFMSSFVKEE